MAERSGSLRHAAVVVAGYWLLFAWVFAEPIFDSTYLIESDLYEFFLPLFLAPPTIWSSFEFGGMPVFADPGDTALYPLHVLFRALGSWTGLVISAFVVAAAGTYAYVYSLTQSRTAAAVAGLIYALSEAMIEHVAHFGVLHTIAWVPLIALSIDALRGPSAAKWIPLGAALLALCFLGGNPQTFLYAGYALGLYAVAGGIAERASWRYYAALGAMGLLGGLLTAVKSAPMLEASLYTARQAVNFGQFAGHANSPLQMLSIVFPAIVHEGREAPTYVGLATIGFAVAALAQARRNWRVIYWAVIAILALALGAGESTPLARLAFGLPAYDLFRVAARHLFLATLALAVLAAFAVAAAQQRRTVIPLLAGLGALGVLLVAGAVRLGQGVEFDEIAGARWLPWHDAVGNQVAFALLAAMAAAWFTYSRGSRPATAALLVILAVDLVHAVPFPVGLGGLDLPTMARAAAEPSVHAVRLATEASQQRILAPAGTQLDAVVPAVFARVWRIPITGGYGPMMLARYGQLAQTGTNGAVDPSMLADHNSAADLTATRFVVIQETALQPAETFERRGITWTTALLDRPIGPPECGQRFPRRGTVALPPEVNARRIAVVLHLRCGEDTRQGTVLGSLTVSGTSGIVFTRDLVAGVDVAEEGLASEALGSRARHQPADVFDTEGAKHTYFLQLDLPVATPGARLEVALGAAASALIIDRVTAIDDDGRSWPQTAASLALHDAGRWTAREGFATSRQTDRGEDEGGEGEERYAVFENRRAQPRAWLVPRTIPVSDRELDTAVHFSLLPDGSRFDPARVALSTEGSAATTASPGRAAVTLQAIHDGRMDISVSSESGGMLIVSENAYPGWRAMVDGQDTPIQTVNGSLQGIPVASGNHEVSLVFDSVTRRIGGLISIVALVAVAFLLAVALRRRPAVSSSTA